MATIRENRRERYLTFDPERRSRFSNRWEIVLVVLIISAGIVITTIAAIKARGQSDSFVSHLFHATPEHIACICLRFPSVLPSESQTRRDQEVAAVETKGCCCLSSSKMQEKVKQGKDRLRVCVCVTGRREIEMLDKD